MHSKYELVCEEEPVSENEGETLTCKVDDRKLYSRIKCVRRRCFAFMLAFNVLAFTAFCMLSWWPVKPHLPHKHEPKISLEEWRNGTFGGSSHSIEWLKHGTNGEFVQKLEEQYNIAQILRANSTSAYIAPRYFNDSNGNIHAVDKIEVNRDKTYVILRTDTEKNWRHSTFAKYWIHNVADRTTTQLSEGGLSFAKWDPSGEKIVYVKNRNVFVFDLQLNTSTQVTFDGGEDVFNGVPDWVYEEEVFSGDSAVWWSLSGNYLGYLRTNDSEVHKFPIPYFVSPKNETAQYPLLTNLKYPKPGTPNPQVEYWIHDSVNNKTDLVPIPTELWDPIISEVIWVGEESVVKMSDRVSDHLEVWVINPKEQTVLLTRSLSSRDIGGAWFEVTHNSRTVGNEGYIDTIDVHGYNHLALFSPANSTTPKILTTGEWEVNDLPMGVNLDTRHVYFLASKQSSIEENLHRVSLDVDSPITDPELVAYRGSGMYDVQFSGDNSFAMVLYGAPDAPPVQYITDLPADLSKQRHWDKSKNEELKKLLIERGLIPESGSDNKDGKDNADNLVSYGTVELETGAKVNYREIRPTNFNPKRKHPVLFFNYGGPISQTIKKVFHIEFQTVFAELHNAVIVTIDPRGTAKLGRDFRKNVRDHIGENEADDVIAAGKIWADKPYINKEKTAIWGWSYGGFLTLKTLERDTDLVFKYGVAVAPVTNWALYDSIYTERYMHTPELNPEGYAKSKISNVEQIGKHKRTLIMHGTGDDNVHFQNTLLLLDDINRAGVENVDVHVFPDSDHSISFHNANTIVYDKISSWLGQFFD